MKIRVAILLTLVCALLLPVAMAYSKSKNAQPPRPSIKADALRRYYTIRSISYERTRHPYHSLRAAPTVPIIKFVLRADTHLLVPPEFSAEFLDKNGARFEKSMIFFGGTVGDPSVMQIDQGQVLYGWVALPKRPFKAVRVKESGVDP